MKIKYFQHEKEDFNKVETKRTYRVSNACECGCSPNPFVLFCDGNNNYMNLVFETTEELELFQQQVSSLKISADNKH